MKWKDLKHGDMLGDDSALWIVIVDEGGKKLGPNLILKNALQKGSTLHPIVSAREECPYVVVNVCDVIHKIIKGEYESR